MHSLPQDLHLSRSNKNWLTNYYCVVIRKVVARDGGVAGCLDRVYLRFVRLVAALAKYVDSDHRSQGERQPNVHRHAVWLHSVSVILQ